MTTDIFAWYAPNVAAHNENNGGGGGGVTTINPTPSPTPPSNCTPPNNCSSYSAMEYTWQYKP